MALSTDYSRNFFDLSSASGEQRAACHADFTRACAAALRRQNARPDRIEACTNELWQRMSEPHRHYHTPVHVLSMFSWADRLGMVLSDAQTLAIWCHDVIWESDAEDDRNEQRSADWLIAEARTLELDEAVASEAAEAIRWTATHLTPEVPAAVAPVLDLDLAGFASEASVFRTQSAAVRKEMGHFDDAAFAAGTVKFFHALLARDRLYRTEAAQVLEAPARAALTQEVHRLSQQLPSA
ncbi:MAG: hypothetical protein WD294_13965 [Phycisphaeraceae bacterium]